MQPKRPRINPLILALALAAVLMVWSVMGSGSGSTSGSTMSYSTVVHYFEHNQVTAFTLDRNTSVITLNLKEGDLPLPDVSSTQSTTQATGGLLSGMFSTSSESTGAVQEDDGTVTVRYKLPYAYVFIENVEKYIESYDAANPDAPMTYDYTSLKETIPWMEIIFYLGMLGCTGFLLFSMMRGGVGGGGGIMNVGKAKVKDEHENKTTATCADVAGEDEEKEELKEVVEFLKSPDKFNSLGARIPHGVLLVGPPGTGKTLLAARRSRKAITMEDIEEASMKVMAGPEKKSRVVTPEEKKLTAYHEAGHAVAGFYCKHHPRVHEITIIPRGQAGGYTMYLPEKDRSYVTKGEMFEDIVSSLGGRVAEQLILDDISTGASNDLQQATNIARQMITKYGFSERLGPVVYGTSQEETFLGRDFGPVSYTHLTLPTKA